tara:strand:- start:1004 stop:1837 length:834 start_codon:yes stop_codon:yes gene_type:complete
MSLEQFSFSIYRIIGNELPLRDEPGGRLASYEFILQNEPEWSGVYKCWIINRVYNQAYISEIVSLLLHYNANFLINPFIGKEYRKCETRDEKTLYAINANVGRNFALHNRVNCDFTMVFDGECMLTDDAYRAVVSEITDDQAMICDTADNFRHYYSLPMKRVAIDDFQRVPHSSIKLEEPQLVFGRDSKRTFNEAMVYPDEDKCELLWKIGHSREPGRHFVVVNPRECLSVGYVLHINSGSNPVETSLDEREIARTHGKDILLSLIDEEFNALHKTP